MELYPDGNATASPPVSRPTLSLSNDDDNPSDGVVVLCCIIMVVAAIEGTLANAFVIGCMVRKKSLRTSVNILMANMAAAGLLATMTCTPTVIILLINQPGNYHRLRVAEAEYALAIFFDVVNLVSLASVGLERLQAVVRPYDKDFRFRRAYMAIGISWATAFTLCLVAMLTYSNWSNLEEEGWQWISMFYSDFYGNIFIPLSCLAASAILGLYAAILLLLRKQSKKMETRAVVAPLGDAALDDKQQQQHTTRLFSMSSVNLKTEQSKLNLSPSKTERLDSDLFVRSNQSSSNPEADLSSSDLNRPRDSPPTNDDDASELRITSASMDFSQIRKEHTTNLSHSSQTSEINNKTELNINVRQSKSARHGSIDSRTLKISVAADLSNSSNKSNLAKQPSNAPTFQRFLQTNNTPTPTPRLMFRNSIAVSRPTLHGNSAGGLAHVDRMCDMKGSVPVLRKASNVHGDIFVISNMLREKGKRSVEGRTVRLSAIAVAAFLFCWLPFPVIVSYQKHYGRRNGFETGLFLFGLSLSFLGSAVNQLVYCLVNRQLRQEFTTMCAQIVSKLRKCI